jgi:putative MATE family efflux protein
MTHPAAQECPAAPADEALELAETIEPPETAAGAVLNPEALPSLLSARLRVGLAQGSVLRRVLTLAWPSVLEQSLATLIGLVDTYIVGHLGAAAIAGVGLGGQMLNLSAAFFGAVGVGATALIARHIGAKEPEESNRLAQQAMLVALGIGLLVAVICFVFAPQILLVFGAEAEVVQDGVAWLRIVSPSFVFLGILLVGNATLRGAGDTRTPLIVMAVANVVNVAVAWTFTHGLFGLPNLGVRGSGLGAASGQIAAGLVVIGLLIRGRGPLRLGLRFPVPDWARIKRILNIGLPSGAEQIMMQVAMLTLALVIARFGTAAYAAHQIGLRIAAMAYLPGWGFSVAATTMVGQELGARRPDVARRAAYAAFLCGLVVMSLLGLFLFVFEAPILLAFTDDVGVIEAGATVIRLAALFQPFMAASFIFSGSLRGAGDTRVTMLISLSSIWGLRLVCAYVLGIAFGLGLLGAWIGIGIDFVVRGLLFWRRLESGRWARLRI